MHLIEHINIGRNNPGTSTYKPPVIHGLRDGVTPQTTLCGLRVRGISHGWYQVAMRTVDCKQCLKRITTGAQERP